MLNYEIESGHQGTSKNPGFIFDRCNGQKIHILLSKFDKMKIYPETETQNERFNLNQFPLKRVYKLIYLSILNFFTQIIDKLYVKQ